MKLPTRLIALGSALAFSLPVAAFELAHSAGTLKLADTPKQIVTFDLAVLDSLNTLGVPVAGVPKSVYQGELEKYAQAPVVGTLFEPDYPALEKLRPDLIIAGGRSQKAMPELGKLAPTVSFTSDPANFLATFKTANLALASAFGKKPQAEAAIASIEKDVEGLRRANQGKKAAFLFVMKGNVIAHAPGDRFGYAYELTGTESVLPAKDPNAPAQPRPEAGSPEAKAAAEKRAQVISDIAKADPDWLIVLDRGAINNGEKTAADTLAKHPELSRTRAYKEGKVYYADPNGWYVMGGGLSNLKAITGSLLTAMK
ncbi:ABC transporter substrate-binding protein [Parapusillimonas granuli]|uniref:ABC transporter substrate-binding protein n=1 Tax=Parapusillimonas granuli TaxID=380911 RepID=UPI00182967A2|nr:iron complex transport system substrate-binding protein [Parapusillimonas granuli]MEB2401589.1 ABC transporter substrate-binding protein [Alcaligenaceae bacterium]